MNAPTYHNNMLQGSDEWHAARCGVLTASTVKSLFTTKGAPSFAAGTKNFALEKAAERVTQWVEPQFYTQAMARGHRDEEIARDIYSAHHAPVEETGFVTRKIGDTAVIGYSPDGLVGSDGLIEVKSRAQKYQMQTIVNDTVPREYLWQIQTGLLVTGRKWCDFISFCGGMAMFVCRVEPDADMQADIATRAIAFDAEVREYVEQYHALAADCIVPDRPAEDAEMYL